MRLVLFSLWELVLRQFVQILPWWLLGGVLGACVSAFAGPRLRAALGSLGGPRHRVAKLALAAALGAASPICMYGTIPLLLGFHEKGVPQNMLAAFMVSSILINPNLFVFSLALGVPLALVRLGACLLAGIVAGSLVGLLPGGRLFDFSRYQGSERPPSGLPPWRKALRDVNNTLVKTAPYVAIGILAAALFEQFVPKDVFSTLFRGNRGLSVLVCAGLGVPVYVCGGGTIPMVQAWMQQGMGMGSALAFLLSGPATKISNLSAVKAVLGGRNFALYLAYVVVYAVAAGFFVDSLFLLFGGL